MPSYQTPTGQDTTITLPTGAAIIALGIGGALALRSVLRDHVTFRAEMESIADARTGRISEHLTRLEQDRIDRLES
ncbi:MAG: hypothetical protein ACRDQ0_03175, partial [Pseudonocardia sp.]